MKVSITVSGKDELIASFRKVEKGILDLRELGTWDAVASEFYKILWSQFSSEGSDGKSGAWKKLSPAYEKRKLKQYGQVPILQASGKLWRSLTQKGAAGSVLEKDKMTMIIGSDVEYGKYHQSTKPRTKIPRRPPIDFTQNQLDQLAKPIQAKLKQLVANARLRDVRGF